MGRWSFSQKFQSQSVGQYESTWKHTAHRLELQNENIYFQFLKLLEKMEKYHFQGKTFLSIVPKLKNKKYENIDEHLAFGLVYYPCTEHSYATGKYKIATISTFIFLFNNTNKAFLESSPVFHT